MSDNWKKTFTTMGSKAVTAKSTGEVIHQKAIHAMTPIAPQADLDTSKNDGRKKIAGSKNNWPKNKQYATI